MNKYKSVLFSRALILADFTRVRKVCGNTYLQDIDGNEISNGKDYEYILEGNLLEISYAEPNPTFINNAA